MNERQSDMAAHAGAQWRHVWLPLAFAVGVALILEGRDDKWDPLGRQYGANGPGDLQLAFKFLVFDLLVLYGILRPWSYRRSWGRSLVALLILAPWAFFSIFATMHSGHIMTSVAAWQVLMVIALAIAVVVSAIGAWRNRRVPLERGRQTSR
jgi:hypothetical protein